jgi:hypothetical protein
MGAVDCVLRIDAHKAEPDVWMRALSARVSNNELHPPSSKNTQKKATHHHHHLTPLHTHTTLIRSIIDPATRRQKFLIRLERESASILLKQTKQNDETDELVISYRRKETKPTQDIQGHRKMSSTLYYV